MTYICVRHDAESLLESRLRDRNALVDSYAKNSPAVAGIVRTMVGDKPRYSAFKPVNQTEHVIENDSKHFAH